METFKKGDLALTWLNGGMTHLDGGAMFGVVPKVLWSKKYPSNEKNQVPLRTDPIFFQAGGKNILIESGIGKGKFSDKMKRNYGVTEESRVDEDLQSLGLTEREIDLVLMTHLHFDHSSGLTKWENGELVSAFPNAEIIVSEIEWNEMRNPNVRSKNTYWKENWKPVEHQVRTFKGQTEPVPGVVMHHTGGHSDGHSIIMLETGEESIVHMADLMPTRAHQNILWVLAFDDYPMDSIEQKQKWMEEAYSRNAWFTFYHDEEYRAIKWSRDGKEVIDAVKREERK